jgi:hypothetical protein
MRTRLAASLDDCFGIVLIDDELCRSRFRFTVERDFLSLIIVSYSSSSCSADDSVW